ncbi:terminase [Paenibacillus sp. 79R4]|uniref:phage terminase small subunit-related protein n=1 Tax=Paenibacillus sp. 79R4 TaxID=2212847 RepID=UPI0015B7D212|nr:phage terminase small subunit-related protein [Paenibacillus sp. 79R4]NWL89580.1 terminase [Paenibacillus sp. 79R4]
MARERSPDRDKAKQMWLESGGTMKLKDIAAALSVGDSKIRKWKSLDNWEAELKGSAPSESKGNAPRRGAPKGNKNAVGNRGGAPPGNQNAMGNKGGQGGPPGNKKAVTTGEHESILLDTLDDDERVLFDAVRTEPLEQINNDIRICDIRIRRMMLRLQRVRSGEESKSTDRKYQMVEGSEGKPPELREVERVEKERAKLERELAIEDALTRVLDKKTKLLELKHKMLVDEAPPEETEDDGFMDALKGMTSEVWADVGNSSET